MKILVIFVFMCMYIVCIHVITCILFVIQWTYIERKRLCIIFCFVHRKTPGGQDFAENIKHKVWHRFGLDCLEIVKSELCIFSPTMPPPLFWFHLLQLSVLHETDKMSYADCLKTIENDDFIIQRKTASYNKFQRIFELVAF